MSSPDPQGMRIGHDEREAAVRALGEHFAAGRLDPAEYEQRMSAAYAARTVDDLEPLFDDLPQVTEGPTAIVPAPGATTAAPAPGAALAPRAPAPAPDAPYGRDPVSGMPYSDRHQVVAGVLQLVLPFGVGRFYSGHIGLAVAQLLTSFLFVGLIWSFIDGIILLCGRPTDRYGRPLRP